MIDHADPEKPKLLDEKKLMLDHYWRQGLLGDVTYLRSLFIMGYKPAEANTELNLLRMENSKRAKDPSVA